MTMPGFTAEASLYKTSGSYRMAGTLGQADAAIYPAVIDPNCVGDCFQGICGEPPFCSPNQKAGVIALCRRLCARGGF